MLGILALILSFEAVLSTYSEKEVDKNIKNRNRGIAHIVNR